MTITSNLPKETPQEVRDLIEQLEKDRDTARAAEKDARAELEMLKNPTRPDVRTITDKKAYERIKAEALRSLARTRLRNPTTAPEPVDVRSLSPKEYESYKRRMMDAVRQRRS